MVESHNAGPDAVGSPDALEDLMRRAQRGDRSSLPELNRYFDEHPQVWRQYGDLGKRAQQAWTAIAVESDLFLSESIGRKLAELERSVVGPQSSNLEGLLAKRVAFTWLACHLADLILAQAKGAGAPPGIETHLQRVQERSQRMYLQAIKALATVRKLLPAPDVAKQAKKSKSVPVTAPYVADPIFATLADELDLAGDTRVPNRATKPRGPKTPRPRYQRARATR